MGGGEGGDEILLSLDWTEGEGTLSIVGCVVEVVAVCGTVCGRVSRVKSSTDGGKVGFDGAGTKAGLGGSDLELAIGSVVFSVVGEERSVVVVAELFAGELWKSLSPAVGAMLVSCTMVVVNGLSEGGEGEGGGTEAGGPSAATVEVMEEIMVALFGASGTIGGGPPAFVESVAFPVVSIQAPEVMLVDVIGEARLDPALSPFEEITVVVVSAAALAVVTLDVVATGRSDKVLPSTMVIVALDAESTVMTVVVWSVVVVG